ELLDATVIEPGRRRATVLREDLREVTAARQRRREGALEEMRVDDGHESYHARMPLRPGLSASAAMTVSEADTALALGSGDVPVVAPPGVVLLAEQATLLAVAGETPDDTTTVGYRVQLDHLMPSPVGEHVRAEAVLELVEGRRLTFRVSVNDDHGLVAAGRITRVVVDRARFLEKAKGAV